MKSAGQSAPSPGHPVVTATRPLCHADSPFLPAPGWMGLVRLLAVVAIIIALAPAPPARADVGFEGHPFTGTGTPTGTKRAESLLWHNDGSWWANMWDAGTRDFHIFRLDVATQTWIDTGVVTDPRSNTHGDALWDGTHLYLASHLAVPDGEAALEGYPSYLYRYSYDPRTREYSLDPGFPVTINNYRTETLVIDKDSTGRLWATWQQDNRIYVNRTTVDDWTWGTPFALPSAGGSVTVDDTSSVIAFGGDRIGVMWSDQTATGDGMYFSVHRDGDPDQTWDTSRAAIQGPGSADDHMNLKSVQADASGRVLAAVKTSFTAGSAPLILLLDRDFATGEWTSHTVARVEECPNRPTVLLDESSRVVHVYVTFPAPPDYLCSSSGGAIHEKASPLDGIAFETGSGSPVMLDSDSPYVHNATSTKQNVGADTDVAVLASNLRTGFYWHAFQSLSHSDLSISASPAKRSIRRGSSATYTVTATPSGGFAADVTFTVGGLPAGTTATWSTNPVVVGGDGPVSTDLVVFAGAETQPATTTFTITGTGGGIARTAEVALQIKK